MIRASVAHHAPRALFAVLALAFGCRQHQKPAWKAGPLPEGYVTGAVCGVAPRSDGGCRILRDPLDLNSTCARVELEYEPGAELAADEAMLDALAAEMRRIPALTDVEIVAASASNEDLRLLDRRIGHLLDGLSKRGISRERLSRAYQAAEHRAGFVFFIPYACEGAPIVR